MKIKYLLAIIMVVLLVGCAQKQATEPAETTQPEKPVAQPEAPAEETAPEVPQEEAAPETEETTAEEMETPEGVDVTITRSGFKPEEVTVKKGGSLVLKVMDENRHAISSRDSDIFRSASMVKGDITEIPLDTAGEFTFMDVVYGNRLIVTVTE